MSVAPPLSTTTASKNVLDLQNKIKAFMAPMYGESSEEKQAYIDQNYPDCFPHKPILDCGFGNYILQASDTLVESKWRDLVRFSLKMPLNFYNRIMQPRVLKCIDNSNTRYYIARKYNNYDIQYANYYFDPLHFTSTIPIYIEHVDTLTKQNEKNRIIEQLPYCLNDIQARSILTLVSNYPGVKLDLKNTPLNYDDDYRRGHFTRQTRNYMHDVDMTEI